MKGLRRMLGPFMRILPTLIVLAVFTVLLLWKRPSVEKISHEPPRTGWVNWQGEWFLRRGAFLVDADGKRWREQTITTTAYTWLDSVGEQGVTRPGFTATGKEAKNSYGYATDWGVLPKGTEIWVPGYGRFTVDDKCGAARAAWREDKTVVVDVRIPHRRYDGVVRTAEEIVEIALNHGRRENRTAMVRVDQ